MRLHVPLDANRTIAWLVKVDPALAMFFTTE
jgi:hypothetical protein